MTCEICRGEGWVCEVHETEPFGHDNCPGPGIPCKCNPDERVQWKEIYATVHDTGPEKPG
jgi:hypothetical protein